MSTTKIILILAVLLMGLGDAVAETTERPNILILMAEDMGPRVGSFGDSAALTPNLDGLAADGVRFTQTFTTAGVCAPSRAAHITGMYQVSIGAQHMRSRDLEESPYLAVPPPEVKAYPELLRRAGYYTMTNGKLDYQFSSYGAGSGPFTIWDHEGKDPDWNRRAEGQPFFALINLEITHESRMFPENAARLREAGQRQVTAPSSVEVPPYYPDTAVVRQDIAQHYDNIHEMDRQVGEWLRRLQNDGLAESTIVIWTTDHGDGLPRAKREIYDSGIHVPLILRQPGTSPGAGSIDSRLLSFIDIAPSVLTWAGLDVPGWMQGRAVLADSKVEREYVFAAKDRLDEMPFRERIVRDGRFKYLYNYRAGEPGAKPLAYREQLPTMAVLHEWFDSERMSDQQASWFRPRPHEELYDLSADPHEVNNLAGDPEFAAELERMREALAQWRERVPDLSDEAEAEMAARFWPGGEQPVTATPEFLVEGARVEITCATPGASIAYRLNGGAWSLYTGPFQAPPDTQVEAKAVRYGWRESAIAVR